MLLWVQAAVLFVPHCPCQLKVFAFKLFGWPLKCCSPHSCLSLLVQTNVDEGSHALGKPPRLGGLPTVWGPSAPDSLHRTPEWKAELFDVHSNLEHSALRDYSGKGTPTREHPFSLADIIE